MPERSEKFWDTKSEIIRDLVESEEAFLISMGWTCVSINGVHSTWKNQKFEMVYSRNHAILIAKSECSQIGFH